ncbi:MAG TPA: tetratricopeptide repeat protein [Myxococcota bacterium]
MGTPRKLWIGAILVAVSLGLYAQTLAFEFVNWDDPLYVTKNQEVQAGITKEGIAWAFTETKRVNWHPLTWMSHMLDCQIYGLDPRGHHATNILLHALNTLVLFAVFASMTGAPWRSAAVALLFSIHPLHVESVAWISERKDLLSTLLGLLSMWAYVAYARHGGWRRYLLTALFLSLALMSKAMVVTLPFVFLLLDYWPLRRSPSKRLLVEKIPLLLLSAGTCAVTLIAQYSVGGMETQNPLPAPARLANAVVAYATYLYETLWPSGLAFFYPHPYIPESGGVPLGVGQIASSVAVLAAITAAVLHARERRWTVFGWCWFVGTLVPVIGFIQVGHQAMADRYMYLPSIGLFVLLVWGGAEIFEILRSRSRYARLAAVAAGSALLALAATTWNQAGHWRSSMALFTHALEVVPRNPTIRYNVANRLRDQGRIDEAIAHYRRALEATPDSVQLNVNLANVLRRQGKIEEAIALYELALSVDPDHVLANTNLGSAYRALNRLDEAEHHYRMALRAGPDKTALYNLGNLLLSREAFSDAIASYREALEIDARDPRIHNNLASALLASGDADAAEPHFRAAISAAPRYYRAYKGLGNLLQERGDLEGAIALYQTALRIEPEYAAAHSSLASALRAQGRPEEAAHHYRRALEIDPGDDESRRSLRELGERSAPRGR